ncbi:acyl-CoA synthetase (AMP-forming)/AMP-acid ligase II/thioesterase domain-containing protein [Streptomyces sp. SAI-135]|uniref:non-ribosomal peptide synthetase n=1 Tax=unclassified Streptomyces TaxID=2593676 RepID=UPI002475B14D|nr:MULTISPECIES: non-ribosomal peptide synthetase [unclassified Streptomyces]MDH6523456.1 acyl-CoA synthetase (AMP-forming)/AMP-acid ligase II/thioesterase domain-containing protein [Streptomyces sp. SAI-090]MDH6574349.1 acyl-CoA synthetase (AMP-forming)/AMP-acid ligase II/thioesterase domain-containing protein [Streptomyces sp. SAI-117]MDH6580927.1 acyl-CoA synthetase (AMP-forming)/AMP-acid ligase II/thioesterase domain-containing protein [Streptomyces sp. SAI-133]MDH6612931.1 acyl-CoA synthet
MSVQDTPSAAEDERYSPRTAAELLLRAAHEHPDNGIGCLDDDPEAAPYTMRYPQLLSEATRLLHALRARGARPGRPVVLLLEQPRNFLPALWACLLGALTACPLTPLRGDPERWAAQLHHVAALLDDPLVLTTPELRAQMPAEVRLDVADLTELATGDIPRLSGDVVARPEDLALLVLTSGSTGTAKAVQLTHANLVASMRAKAEAHGAGPADITFNWVSYDHVAAVLEGHLLPVATGATQLHMPPHAVLADPVVFLRALSAHRVTATFTPNFLLGLINTRFGAGPLDDGLDLSHVHRIISGGEANPVATGKRFLELLAPHGLARTALWPAFGMTETCAGSLYNREFPGADADGEFAAVGRAVTGLEVRIADPATGATPPAGTPGEVWLRGPMVTTGYYRDAAATAAALTPEGWLRTGDLGLLEDGRLTLAGRGKDSIIVNGVNYYSHDLESVLTEVEGVAPSFVAAFPVRPSGSDTEQLAVLFAATVVNEELPHAVARVRDRVVAHWGFRPAVILPLPRSEFSKTSLGKVQRGVLRARWEAGSYTAREQEVAALLAETAGGHSDPQGPTETALAEIYAELFGLTAISATAGFFDLGGTSLDVLRLARTVRARLGVELAVLDVLRAPSARELARLIDAPSRAGVAYDPVVTLQAGGEGTPLFCVHPGVGEVLVFVNLAKHFAGERPFHALRARGFNPGEKPFGSFTEMTRSYVAAIRRVQPHGPYALAGYSFGAAVAFEIAKVLEADGERVAFLGSFNLPPHIKYRMEELDFVETAVNLAMFLGLVDADEAGRLPRRLRSLPKTEQIATLLDSAPPGRLAQLDLDLPRLSAWADLAHGLTSLGRTYHPTGQVRAMTVFCADPLRGTRHDWVEKELRRWDEHTREDARYVDVPGEHYTMIGPRHVHAFAALLRAELARAFPVNALDPGATR